MGIIPFPLWFSNTTYHAAPIPSNDNVDYETFFQNTISAGDGSSNLIIASKIIPKMLRILPTLSWNLVKKIDEKYSNFLNEKYMKEILKECQELQLSKKVAEHLNVEPPVTSDIVNSLVDKRVKKETKQDKEDIKRMKMEITLLKKSLLND